MHILEAPPLLCTVYERSFISTTDAFAFVERDKALLSAQGQLAARPRPAAAAAAFRFRSSRVIRALAPNCSAHSGPMYAARWQTPAKKASGPSDRHMVATQSATPAYGAAPNAAACVIMRVLTTSKGCVRSIATSELSMPIRSASRPRSEPSPLLRSARRSRAARR